MRRVLRPFKRVSYADGRVVRYIEGFLACVAVRTIYIGADAASVY